ncbi:MAG: FAD-dependent monooxygenase [Actinomycetota bacterium]
MTEPRRIGVVGGSLGGLTAACLLVGDGHDVTVYERSPRPLEQRGAGIGLLPATWRYLVERAGVSIDDLSVETGFIRYLDRSGAVLHESAHRYLFSSWNTVFRETIASFDAERYLLGHELTDFACDGDGVTGTFANGKEARWDLLVAADGIGSLVRARLQPQAAAHYAGYVAWRGTVPEADLDRGLVAQLSTAITYHVGSNSHVLVYPIPNLDGDTRAGSRLINFVWYRNYAAGDALTDLLTDRDGRTRALSVPPGAVTDHHVAELRAYATAHLPSSLATVVTAVDEPFVQLIQDIAVEQMVFGRTVLLGDSAFAVRPHAAAGTAKATDDGWQLAAALAAHDHLDDALSAWEGPQLGLGADLLRRTQEIGRRSQVENSWVPGDPSLIFGLHEPGN